MVVFRHYASTRTWTVVRNSLPLRLGQVTSTATPNHHAGLTMSPTFLELKEHLHAAGQPLGGPAPTRSHGTAIIRQADAFCSTSPLSNLDRQASRGQMRTEIARLPASTRHSPRSMSPTTNRAIEARRPLCAAAARRLAAGPPVLVNSTTAVNLFVARLHSSGPPPILPAGCGVGPPAMLAVLRRPARRRSRQVQGWRSGHLRPFA